MLASSQRRMLQTLQTPVRFISFLPHGPPSSPLGLSEIDRRLADSALLTAEPAQDKRARSVSQVGPTLSTRGLQQASNQPTKLSCLHSSRC